MLLFAGLLYSQHLQEFALFLRSSLAFILFCLLSGALYMVNDLKDLEKDRMHPVKRLRPLASGRLSRRAAVLFSAMGIPLCMVFGFLLDHAFGWILAVYALLILSYSFYLKQIVILDVIVIASGFVLRAVAGAVVIRVDISSWLLICTIFLSLFLVLNKRRHELFSLGDHAGEHRTSLSDYSVYLLDLLTVMTAACALMAYALYTTSPSTVEKFGSRGLVLTLPFVIFGLFRYLYLVHQKGLGGSPEDVLLKDRAMIANMIFYLTTTGVIIYF